MTILPAGSFMVSDKRKPIPAAVSRAVRKRYQEDHRPPLSARDYDTVAGDFIPPQHDPACIFLIEKAEHDRRTFGRQPGAEKTVTTRGSDVGEAARTRKIRRTQQQHNARMAAKIEPNAYLDGLILEELGRSSERKPKRKIASRGFDKRHRPLRSRNNLRRAKR